MQSSPSFVRMYPGLHRQEVQSLQALQVLWQAPVGLLRSLTPQLCAKTRHMKHNITDSIKLPHLFLRS